VNARAFLITATLTLALIGPAAAEAATRTIPWDAPLSKLAVTPHHLVMAGRTSAHNAQPYVHGGASQKVAKAIVRAGKKGHTVRTIAKPLTVKKPQPSREAPPLLILTSPATATAATTSSDPTDACAIFQSECAGQQTSDASGNDGNTPGDNAATDASPVESPAVDQTSAPAEENQATNSAFADSSSGLLS